MLCMLCLRRTVQLHTGYVDRAIKAHTLYADYTQFEQELFVKDLAKLP